jgi:enoyl-CoA hydratase/carnithine racemase
MATFETLLFDVSDGVGIITLNRPEKYNSADETLVTELEGLYKELRYDDSVKVVVLTGAGEKAFCTGIDRDFAMNNRQPESPFMMDDPMLKLGPKQADLWKPVIAAVNGMAGGGAFYALGEAEFIIAAEHATFFDPHTTYGMAACFEPMFMFGQMPWGELCRMSLMGNYERISAQTALGWGMVSEVVPGDKLLEHTVDIAAKLASLPQIAVQGTLRSLWARRNMPRNQAIATANHLVEIGNRPEALAEGQAFFASGVRVEPRVR